jgi:hypothetical protein
MDICAAFHAIETSVWDLLQVGRREQHQLGEETITDLISLALKTSQKQSVRMINYTKPQEGRNGADWLWIFYDPSTRQAIGIRIQAKIINFKSNRYPHLHYTKNGIKQIDKLERLAIRDHVTPLYVFYSHWPRPTSPAKYPRNASHSGSIREFGCAIATLPSIRSLNNLDAMKDVGPLLHPWHVLVCPGATGRTPILKSVSAALGSMLGGGDGADDPKSPRPRPINEFPPYIGHLLEKVLGPEPDQASEGEGQEAPDEDLAGVVFFLSPTNGASQEQEASTNWRAMAPWSSLSHPGERGDHA